MMEKRYRELLKNIEQMPLEEKKKYIDELLMSLEEIYYKNYKLELKSEELFSKKIALLKDVKKIHKTIILLRKLRNNLYDIKQDNIVSDSEIIKIDYKYGINTYLRIKSIELSNSSKYIIRELTELKNIYLGILRKEKNNKATKEVKNVLNYISLKLTKEQKKKRKNQNEIENSNIKTSDLIKKEEKNLTPSLNKDIEECKSISHYSLDYIIESVRDVIRHGEINEGIINYINDIVFRIKEENKMNDEKYINYIYSLLDSIKYRKQELEKENNKEIETLKTCRASLKKLIIEIDLNSKKEDDEIDYKFNIIYELLSSSSNYLTLKKLVNEFPEIVNVRNKNEHVLEYILDEYIKNYKKLLEKDEKDYKNIDFLREVYILFSKSHNAYLTTIDKKNINLKIREFIAYVVENVTSTKRKNHIIKEVKSLATHHFYDEKEFELRPVNMRGYDSQISAIKDYNSNYKERENEVDLTKEYTIMLDDDYTCYSLTDNGRTKSLKIHTCDISNLVQARKSLDCVIYNSMFLDEELPKILLDALKFNINDKKSALTYDITLNNANQIIGFNIYRSKIKPNIRIYEDGSNNAYNEIKNLIRSIVINQNYECKKLDISFVESVLKRFLNDTYLDKIRGRDIPYIYSGKELISSIDDITIYSNIKRIFSYLPKEEFKRLNKILEEDIEEFHYSDKLFNTCGEYTLNLTGKPNYIMLQNQRMIKTLYLNELDLSSEQYSREKRIFKTDMNNLLIDLNNKINYKDNRDFEYSKRRVKKRMKVDGIII